MTAWVWICGSSARDVVWRNVATVNPSVSGCRRRPSTRTRVVAPNRSRCVERRRHGDVVGVEQAGIAGERPPHAQRLRRRERRVEPGHRPHHLPVRRRPVAQLVAQRRPRDRVTALQQHLEIIGLDPSGRARARPPAGRSTPPAPRPAPAPGTACSRRPSPSPTTRTTSSPATSAPPPPAGTCLLNFGGVARRATRSRHRDSVRLRGATVARCCWWRLDDGDRARFVRCDRRRSRGGTSSIASATARHQVVGGGDSAQSHQVVQRGAGTRSVPPSRIIGMPPGSPSRNLAASWYANVRPIRSRPGRLETVSISGSPSRAIRSVGRIARPGLHRCYLPRKGVSSQVGGHIGAQRYVTVRSGSGRFYPDPKRVTKITSRCVERLVATTWSDAVNVAAAIVEWRGLRRHDNAGRRRRLITRSECRAG